MKLRKEPQAQFRVRVKIIQTVDIPVAADNEGDASLAAVLQVKEATHAQQRHPDIPVVFTAPCVERII